MDRIVEIGLLRPRTSASLRSLFRSLALIAFNFRALATSGSYPSVRSRRVTHRDRAPASITTRENPWPSKASRTPAGVIGNSNHFTTTPGE